jgi:hypothetical protein
MNGGTAAARRRVMRTHTIRLDAAGADGPEAGNETPRQRRDNYKDSAIREVMDRSG